MCSPMRNAATLSAVCASLAKAISSAWRKTTHSEAASLPFTSHSAASRSIPRFRKRLLTCSYFVVKNHSFHDGNKRIAASLFLYFLDRNGILYEGKRKRIGDDALVATTIMIAESRPDEKEAMVSLVMNFLALGNQ